MTEEISTTKVRIKCPECDAIQDAIVKHNAFYNTYIHICKVCGYVIMESEWNEVKDKEE